jgi:bifunctional DNA-binding transcriptional regulator/antitoxin component of YhaV-PrlF toxin-antitoxin module
MPDGRLSLPAELRRRYGLEHGGDVVVQDTGDAIVVRTISQLTAHVQAMSREILKGKPNASVDDFLADRRKEAWDE